MRRFRESGAAAFVVACALLVIAACYDEPVGVADVDPSLSVSEEAGGSHFRYATLSWAPSASPGDVQFRLVAAFRRTAYFGTRCEGACTDGLPGPGDIFVEDQGQTGINFGDGSSSPTLRFRVSAIETSSVNPNEHWVVGEALNPGTDDPGVLHPYTLVGPHTAYLTGFFANSPPLTLVGCCRIFSSILENRGDEAGNRATYPIQTIVDPFSGNSSPTSTMIPIVSVPEANDVEFLIPAGDPDGDPLTFRLATAAEAGGGPVPLHPPLLSVNSSTGLVSWDNVGLSGGVFPTTWTTQIMIEDGATKTPVDFLLRITGPLSGNAPTCTVPAGPITGTVGTEILFVVSATDVEGAVTINSAALPAGAVMTPSLPFTGSSSTFKWTPEAGQEGTFVVLFSATDTDDQVGLCNTTIEVNIIGEDGGDIPVTDEDGIAGTVNHPAGALDLPVGGTAVIIAEITTDNPACAMVDGGESLCLEITIPSGVEILPGAFVTVALCLDDNSVPPPEFAIFRTDEDGTVVLASVFVELSCPGPSTSNLGTNPLTRFARGMWRTITSPFRAQALYATFGHFGSGGRTRSFSGFFQGPQLIVEDARVFTNRNEIRIQGMFDSGGNPGSEDVEIRFWDTTVSLCVELSILGADFERNGDNDGNEFGDRRTASVDIFDDGRYEIRVTDPKVAGIKLEFVSFTIQIGDRLQGVGLEFDDRGRCIGANGSGGCEEEL